MKICKRLANWLTFWIIIPSWRRRLRKYLVELFVGKDNLEIFNSSQNKEKFFPIVQDCLIDTMNLLSERLMVILVPEGDFMSGGIYSFFMIAKEMKSLKDMHGCEVIIMTRPNHDQRTYVLQTHFRNEFIVYRFSQLLLFSKVKDLTIFIPEESASTFYEHVTMINQMEVYLGKLRNLHINIMNQNIRLMPERAEFADLYLLTRNITQTTAHDQYSTQEYADRYGLRTLLIPPFTDLSPYAVIPFEKKKKRILYSPDTHEKKKGILGKLAEKLPEYELKEIKEMTFDEFAGLVSESKFMITFGEGFDGYFAQTFLLGGIAFAVYNQESFPETENFNTNNIFSSYDEMSKGIVEEINRFEEDGELRKRCIDHYVDMQNRLYSRERYLTALKRFCNDDYDVYPRLSKETIVQGMLVSNEKLYPSIQDILITRENLLSERLMVILVPEGDFMSGGIYSFFMIAKEMKSLKDMHGCEVIIMTRPNHDQRTYVLQTHFRNEFIVYRFSQLLLFSKVKDLTIFIPEESASTFYEHVTMINQMEVYLGKLRNLHINIMNQNIRLMPERAEFADLYLLTRNITQTTAHDQYSTQEYADRYGLRTLLIPPFTDLSPYAVIPFEKKKKRILYSPDTHEKKKGILGKLAEKLPEYELKEIKEMTFDEFAGLVSESKFMITFGEGFDGYFAQTFLLGGIAFAVYNQESFPETENFNTNNIFSSYDEMSKGIVEEINRFEEDGELRKRCIDHYVDMQNRLYSRERYLTALKRFCNDDYDIL